MGQFMEMSGHSLGWLVVGTERFGGTEVIVERFSFVGGDGTGGWQVFYSCRH
jgi:hypothetical protein